jgi:hypothetical protein
VNARFASLLLLVALLAAPAGARAQDLGSTAMAVGAAGEMEANPMRGGQQQIQRAGNIAQQNGQSNAPKATGGAPAAAAATVNAVNAAAPAAAPAAAAAGKPGAEASASAAAAKEPAPTPSDPAVDVHAPFRQSFFFTAKDMLDIQKALERQVAVGGNGGSLGNPNAAAAPIPAVRRIALSGVIYKAADDWLIWINGQKVTPKVLLKEIVDIKVERDAVHLKWYDIGADKVLNITMSPNETYDIMTGVLLPGVMK